MGLRAHRVAWALARGAWPKDEIDHKNGVASDNRLENLREATHVETGQNRPRRTASNTSGLSGVYWHRGSHKWRARIRVGGRHHSLGLHHTREAAYAAYLKCKGAAASVSSRAAPMSGISTKQGERAVSENVIVVDEKQPYGCPRCGGWNGIVEISPFACVMAGVCDPCRVYAPILYGGEPNFSEENWLKIADYEEVDGFLPPGTWPRDPVKQDEALKAAGEAAWAKARVEKAASLGMTLEQRSSRRGSQGWTHRHRRRRIRLPYPLAFRLPGDRGAWRSEWLEERICACRPRLRRASSGRKADRSRTESAAAASGRSAASRASLREIFRRT
jgi:hypothetical protein